MQGGDIPVMPVCEQVVGDTVLGAAVDANVVVGSDVDAMPVGSFAGLPVADDVAVLVVVVVVDAVVGVESGVVGDAGSPASSKWWAWS